MKVEARYIEKIVDGEAEWKTRRIRITPKNVQTPKEKVLEQFKALPLKISISYKMLGLPDTPWLKIEESDPIIAERYYLQILGGSEWISINVIELDANHSEKGFVQFKDCDFGTLVLIFKGQEFAFFHYGAEGC